MRLKMIFVEKLYTPNIYGKVNEKRKINEKTKTI